MWGLSFKPETDDMREAPSLDVIKTLTGAGVRIRAYCPQGMREAKSRLREQEALITHCKNENQACQGAHALILMAEWHQFRGADMRKAWKAMASPLFFDLRNVFVKN